MLLMRMKMKMKMKVNRNERKLNRPFKSVIMKSTGF